MKGICFKENMFNQIISGAKTETRRLKKIDKPRYKKGEVVYLKEPYQFLSWIKQETIPKDYNYFGFKHRDIAYKYLDNIELKKNEKWKNKLFMPGHLSRFRIKITSVEIQKLHDITEAEAIAEGIEKTHPLPLGYKNYLSPERYFDPEKKYSGYPGAVMSFFSLWEKIFKVNSLENNTDIFVYKFELI